MTNQLKAGDGEVKSSKLTMDAVCGTGANPRLKDCLLTGRTILEEEIPFAERFVAMSLGADGESVEVKELLHR